MQAFWLRCVLCVCHPVLYLRLRQKHLQPPEIPKKPNFARDQTDRGITPIHGALHCPSVLGGSTWIQQDI
jgi:hypothetical protein